MNNKSKYLTSAFLLVLTSVVVKIVGAVYKIPLTSFIGAVGRGYFAAAYNLYLPIHAITMGAFPVALSKLISKYNASNNKIMLKSLKKGSLKLFSFVGFAGMLIMVVCAYPYSKFVAASPKSVYTILVLAPNVLFSSMAVSYRAYYEGFMNMVPTAVSQLIESVFKLLFGLLFARYSMAYMLDSYLQYGNVFGVNISNQNEALSFIYPFTSAASMLGVTLGSVVSLLYVQSYYLLNTNRTVNYEKLPIKQADLELLSLAFPIMFSTAIQGVFQFLGTASIQYSISKTDFQLLKKTYAAATSNISIDDLNTFAYGIYSTAMDFKNLIPGITMAMGVCAVPVISSAFEMKNKNELSNQINNIFRYTCVLALLGGGILACCGKELLGVLYYSDADIVNGCNQLVVFSGYTVVFASLAGVAVFAVQAIGFPQLSIKSYIVSGIIKIFLNYILVCKTPLLLIGATVSEGISYFVMMAMNVKIFKKKTQVKIKIFNDIIKPLSIFVISLIIFYVLNVNQMDFSSAFVNLLIKASVFSFLFIILCVLFKTLNFRDFFIHLRLKKTP